MGLKISGDPQTTLLEDRFYNISTLFAAITIFIGFATSIIFDFPLIIIIVTCLVGLICSVFYYLGRFRKKNKSYKKSFLLIIIISISIIWFYNEGINGSTTFFFFLAMIGFMFMFTRGQYYIILFIFIAIAIALILIQYFFPTAIFHYPSPETRLFDLSFYFIFMIAITGYAIMLFKINFDKERNTIQKQKETIEEQNAEYLIINKNLLEAKLKAEGSDRLKSAFLANISHEIRTPMNGILGFSQLLKEPHLTGEQQEEFIEHIEKSCVRMLNIITAIVSISKIESGQMELTITETNVNKQTELVYNFFKPYAEQKGLQLIVENTLSSEEAIIISDRNKIFSILNNLVDNAIKFTHSGSIEFGYKKQGKYLEFFVKDTGDGIPDEKKDIIFERFRQGSDEINKSYEGAGLGLSISKAYVELLGGQIWVETELGKGSEFYFTIPYDAETMSEVVIKDVSSRTGTDDQIGDFIVLIVEDDETSKAFLSVVIKQYCKKLFKAINGTQAVEICRNNPDIDLVLMDINIPEIDGYEATRQIRKFNKNAIIIAQTVYGLAGDREKAIESGCNDYISKPINKKELLALIHKYSKK